MLNAENVTVRYGAHTVIDRLSFSLEEGQWLMLVGPNGAGKSSLISAIAREPGQGEVALDLLMIAKYFERIGDHAVTLSEWVEFSVTGVHKHDGVEYE